MQVCLDAECQKLSLGQRLGSFAGGLVVALGAAFAPQIAGAVGTVARVGAPLIVRSTSNVRAYVSNQIDQMIVQSIMRVQNLPEKLGTARNLIELAQRNWSVIKELGKLAWKVIKGPLDP